MQKPPDQRWKETLRIIWTIASKDIVDAIKNKTTLTILIGVTLIMVQSRALALLTGLRATPTAIVYDAGDSPLTGWLREEDGVRVATVPTWEALETALVTVQEARLGLVIPRDFDAALAAGEAPAIEGYYAHWASARELRALRETFERHVAEITGAAVPIALEGHALYPAPDAGGHPFMLSLTLVLIVLLVCATLVPYLLIEEKQARTLDALMVSPATSAQIIAAKALAGMVYGLTASAIVLIFNRATVAHWSLAVMAVTCGTLISVGAGLLLGVLFDHPQTMGLWMGAVLAVLALPALLDIQGGANIPPLIQGALRWTPGALLSRLFRMSFAGSVSPGPAALKLGATLAWAAPLYAVVVWRIRRRDR